VTLNHAFCALLSSLTSNQCSSRLQPPKIWKHALSLFCVVLLICASSVPSIAQIGIIITIAGGGPKNVQATRAHLHNPTDIVTDSQGNIFIVTSGQNEVFRVDAATGVLTPAAGSDSNGFSGDNGPAKQASLNTPYGLAVDAAGNLFIADSYNERIRRVDAVTHRITTFAGGGTPCAGRTDGIGDGCPATNATLYLPSGLAVDGAGNVLIADLGHNRIRRVDVVTGVITTVAGGGKGSILNNFGDGGLASSATLSYPQGLSLDGAGNLLIADTDHNRIRRVDATTNIISTVAGGLSRPVRVVADAVGNLFITESTQNRIRRVDVTSGVITTFAGTGGYGYAGDNGPAASATLANPYGINFDRGGNLLIADAKNNRLRRVDVVSNLITTSAGASGPRDFDLLALQASLSSVGQVVIDGAGNVFMPESCCTILRLDSASHFLSKVAGSEFGGPDINSIFGLARDRAGNLFVADETAIRRVDSVTGVITTVAGNGSGCPQETDALGDGCPATDAGTQPLSVAVDDVGNLFIGDGVDGNSLVRRVDAGSQIITLVAGGGSGCPQQINDIGDGCPATQVDLGSVGGVAVDSADNVFIATGSRIRRVNARTHVITTVAGTGNEAYSGDGGPATSAGVAAGQVAVDGVGNLFITEPPNNRIRRVDAVTKVITTVAGNGVPGVGGDGGLATKASIRPAAASVDGMGNLFIGDGPNFRVRKVSLGLPGILLSTTALNFGNVVLNTQSSAQTVTVTNNGTALLEFFSIGASGRFRQSNTCKSGVQPGATCQVSVIFVPNSVGAQSATLTIRPNVPGGARKVTLSGVGINQ
jgi:sugar lactone lactonase YvrE